MNMFVRYCIICGTAFDIGINYEICQKCREKVKKEEEKDAD